MDTTSDYAASFLPILGGLQLLSEATVKTGAAIDSLERQCRELEYLWLLKRTEAEKRQYYRLRTEDIPIFDAMRMVEQGK